MANGGQLDSDAVAAVLLCCIVSGSPLQMLRYSSLQIDRVPLDHVRGCRRAAPSMGPCCASYQGTCDSCHSQLCIAERGIDCDGCGRLICGSCADSEGSSCVCDSCQRHFCRLCEDDQALARCRVCLKGLCYACQTPYQCWSCTEHFYCSCSAHHSTECGPQCATCHAETTNDDVDH